ncbi:MAG: hypothetical protein HY074_07510 [Deltaproteobacteria bacterium]|nr:hypothetical protein [Deltaproteobacteria bacterium]
MSKGRWKKSEEQLAKEAYAVLIRHEKSSRAHSKPDLVGRLKRYQVYADFLKLCVEYDDSADLEALRRGLLFVVRAQGASSVAHRAGFSRMSLYRMLAKGGNPRLKNLIALFRALNMHLWLVDASFVKTRERFTRPKDQPFTWDMVSSGRRIKPKIRYSKRPGLTY